MPALSLLQPLLEWAPKSRADIEQCFYEKIPLTQAMEKRVDKTVLKL
jgi:hypothetical protein